ncbi:MAG: NAD(P)/FAD-dependent oxidoreductase [Chloroflexi bacterium]|nr:NAD(P)/FAD-dependent oxidoreductase [Chloroflexota bacterium]
MEQTDFDVLVIGGGSAGYAAARIAGQMGASVGLVERGPVGGLCILDGCMPSKALIRPADVLHLMRTSGDLGLHANRVQVDFARVMERKTQLVEEFAAYRREEIARAPGVELLLGEARFRGPREVALRPTREDGSPNDGRPARTLTARKIVLATGSYAWVPPLPELHEVGYITSEEVLRLEAPPESMVILGAGVIAIELGQFYARMGTRVTMLQRSGRILSHDDAEVGQTLAAHLREEGIHIETHSVLRGCFRRPDGMRVMIADIAGETREFPGALLFVALGRRAAIHGLDLESAGVRLNEDGCFVAVDDAMRTSNPDVYAAGDLATMRQMTHIAVLQGEVAGFNAARTLGLGGQGAADAFLSPGARRLGGVADEGTGGTLRMDYSVVPQVIFSDPPFARVGLNEQEARAAGRHYLAARYDFADLGMAQVMGQTKGFVKMLADRRDGRVLGVQILGHQADTLIHEAIVAMAFGATAEQLARIPHYHPALAEILTYPAEELAAAVRR